MVQSVTPQQTVLCDESAIHLHPSSVVEVEFRVPQRQRRPLLHRQVAIDHQRRCCLDLRVSVDHGVIELLGIPGPGPQVHLLLTSALQTEEQVVFHQLRSLLLCRCSRQFHKHQDAVLAPDLYIRGLRTVRIVQIHAIDIHAETRLVSSLQSHRLQFQARIVVVVHPEGIRRGGHIAESRVHLQRIYRERKLQTRTRRERVIILAGSADHDQ